MKIFTKVAAGLLVIFCSSTVAADLMILSPTALGPLKLGKSARVSESKLKQLFPSMDVRYEIAQGDSPDFHFFEVSTKSGEVLFTIQSFIKEPAESKKTIAEVPIDLIQIRSRQIKDNYGLRIGDRVKDILAKRGKNLQFGAGHHDVLMGADEIYYSIATESDESPEGFKMVDAVKANWKITSISWPSAAWE